jgi:hypothetical protein
MGNGGSLTEEEFGVEVDVQRSVVRQDAPISLKFVDIATHYPLHLLY